MMMNNMPNHFSHCLELDLGRKPARVSDRTSWRFQLPGIIFGAILFFIGIYEVCGGFRDLPAEIDSLFAINETSANTPHASPLFFDIAFVIVGLGMIAASIASYIRYKKIIFDGKTVTVVYRPVWGEKTTFKENIKAYQGVRFRIEFFQSGLLNKNKYIVELYHKDPRKIIPLYISTSSHNVRKIWKDYARKLNLPTIVNTDSGMVMRDIKNLDKSIKEMAELGYIVDDYDSYEKLPSSVSLARRKDKLVLKARKIVWDVYNMLAWIAIISAGSVLGIISLNHEQLQHNISPNTLLFLSIGTSILIIAAIFILFRKEKIVIKRYKIVNTHKYMLFSTKHDELPKEAIEAIEITENPATGRYFVAIIAEDKTITFGAKLPIADLRWIKKFLIHEIIK